MDYRPSRLHFVATFSAACLLATTAAMAIEPAAEGDFNPKAGTIEFAAPQFEVQPAIENGASRAATRPELRAFAAAHSSDWEYRWDLRNDAPNLIQGRGIAMIPGAGNKIRVAAPTDLAAVESSIRSFLAAQPQLLGTTGMDLRLDKSRSGVFGNERHFWSVELQQFHQGVPVEDAYAFFRINNGNLVQFGNHRLAPVLIDARPAVDRETAFKMALGAAGVTSRVTERRDKGTLKIVPTTVFSDLADSADFVGIAGRGYGHQLIWDFQYRIAGDDHLYRLRVDALTGQPVEKLDMTRMATVEGDIYPTTNTDPLVTVPFPHTTVTNGGTKYTDAAGNYSYSGGTATAALNGRYIRISDNCGSISLSDSATGNLDFGGSAGTDCSTPGIGGAGNTHSARTGYYHLTNINRKAATFHPSNTWVNGTLTANMNINLTCNANWNGSAVNFYRSGGGCSNTGELAAVFLHEWGHGFDTNTGGAAPENGSGEAVGDTFAFLETKDGCIGDNFYSTGTPCFNCRSTCSGVRDIPAFALGGIRTIASPANVKSDTGTNCDRFQCPYRTNGFPYQGPMGYQGHCESYIASTANWDLAQSLVAKYGASGWQEMDQIWYASLTPSKSAYRLASGQKCKNNMVVDGCGSTNWYTVYLPADDDDGNLANGTPNACRIWDAFNAHGIACGARPTCTVP
jgi:trimeric autotransporter adhesin